MGRIIGERGVPPPPPLPEDKKVSTNYVTHKYCTLGSLRSIKHPVTKLWEGGYPDIPDYLFVSDLKSYTKDHQLKGLEG